ncbi:LacI family DNA-binding transcriptional regulator [Micromonospora sp. HUAS LYJ1]|uniref:LacI family DNA-binding transcriptional regulator n=1 Tax=Micromonospora sp. HUAS LYJ1 TaxID=3061626 RepID=UPI0026712951|nr:LacI family DNA-binding transcriptional regulator [Micromonospora sp. HUAS LYJ1]WKU07078.1 LacI family DNA-binding transcriptional regulator [Micromonospora sp. HUAS LYJ1]
MATMHDVARLAQVSVSTVSYVLTGARPISQATRAKVLAAMAQLDYQPNAMARGLASRRSRILGLLLPMDERGLGATEAAFVTGAAAAASAVGYHLVLSPVGGGGDLDELRRLASQRMFDGVVLMEVQLTDERVDALQQAGVPLVLIGRTGDTDGLSYVDIDFEQTVREAVAHLVGLGHRQIVYVNHSAETLASGYGPALRTRDAFVTAMTGHGLEPVMIPAQDSAAGGRAALAAAVARAPGLTAVLAMNETAIFGILGELTARGLTVPDDVSVVSMVTSPQVAELATPALTAMTSPGSAMGRIAVEALVRHLDGAGDERHQQLLPCALEIRGSTAAPRSRRPDGGADQVKRPVAARQRDDGPSEVPGSILNEEDSNAAIPPDRRRDRPGGHRDDHRGRLRRRRQR